MAIKTRLRRTAEFSTASMSDLVFLLLIFFVLVSTLVSPNAIKLLLPSSNSKTMAKQTVTIYINEFNEFFVGETPVTEDQLEALLTPLVAGDTEASIVLRMDKSVAVQYQVNVFDAVNAINERDGTGHRVILAVSPR